MRSDANELALGAVRQILSAAHDFEFALEQAQVRVKCSPLPAPQWSDSALKPPPSVRLSCSWSSGSVDLFMAADRWSGNQAGMVGLKVALIRTQAQLLWITLPNRIRDLEDGQEISFPANLAPFRRKGDGDLSAMSDAILAAFRRSGIPLWREATTQAAAFSLRLPATLGPDAAEVFERLVRIALIKLPGFVREDGIIEGELPYVVPPAAPVGPSAAPAEPEDELEGSKLAGLQPLPGGVRDYKATTDAVLDRVGDGCSRAELESFLKSRYDLSGATAVPNYVNVLSNLGLVVVEGGQVSRGPTAQAYLPTRKPEVLLRALDETFIGVLEMLVVARASGAFGSPTSVALYKNLIGVEWRSRNQVAFRRNWLLSLGAFERDGGDDTLTPLGEAFLAARTAEVLELETKIDALMGQTRKVEDLVEALEDAAPSWNEPLTLSAAAITRHSKLKLAPDLLSRAAAALCSGKNLLLVGPPGTGKTELAEALGEAAKSEGYCLGTFVATASADWTTFDTVGGYALQKDGSLRFRPGALLKALEQKKWLVVDELNRADVDRAFGELMTVLSGKSTDTSYEGDDGKSIRIGPDAEGAYRVPPSFRVIATMNTWDKTSLFRLSFAVQRRFAILHVGAPPQAQYQELLLDEATREGEGALSGVRAAQLARLFSPAGLLQFREIGPAIARDVVRYVRVRAQNDGLAEAVALFVLSQLEGLGVEAAQGAWKAVREALADWAQPAAVEELRLRFKDVFPDAALDG